MEAVQGHPQHGPGRRLNVTPCLNIGKQRKCLLRQSVKAQERVEGLSTERLTGFVYIRLRAWEQA